MSGADVEDQVSSFALWDGNAEGEGVKARQEGGLDVAQLVPFLGASRSWVTKQSPGTSLPLTSALARLSSRSTSIGSIKR